HLPTNKVMRSVCLASALRYCAAFRFVPAVVIC
ncbi:hypothetical protein D030_4298B, partial [Vibrio parahaemolyticus AQ3810]